MKTWRERIAEARERGAFTDKDYRAWANFHTCLVGEQRQRYGIWFPLEIFKEPQPWFLSEPNGVRTLQFTLARSIHANDFDTVERALDAIEDRALELKRAAQ